MNTVDKNKYNPGAANIFCMNFCSSFNPVYFCTIVALLLYRNAGSYPAKGKGKTLLDRIDDCYEKGLKYVLRQDPDIILIGEIRDEETLLAALKAAETGHLVFATLHTNDAVQTINRIVNMIDQSARDLIRRQIAESLRGTIAQKLVFSEKHKKRFPACEVMVVTPTIQDYIIKDNLNEIYNCLKDGSYNEMMTLNMSLAELVNLEKITEEEALAVSEDENDFAKIIKGSFTGTKNYYE